MDWLKIPVLVNTLVDGDGPTSCLKQPVLFTTKNSCKYPQVSSDKDRCKIGFLNEPD